NAVLLPRLLSGAASAAPEPLVELLENPGFIVDARDDSVPPTTHAAEPGLCAYRLFGDRVERFSPYTWTLMTHGGMGVSAGVVDLSSSAEREYPVAASAGEIWRDAAIVHAATLVGAGEASMRDVLEHVKTRQQFGTVIGRFQAIKHLLAEVFVDLEIAW